jgi:hypothetical protein
MSKADDLRRDVQGVNKAITAVEEMTVPKEFRYDDVMIARNCLMEIRSRMMQEIRLIETGIPKDSPRGPGLNTAANRPVVPEGRPQHAYSPPEIDAPAETVIEVDVPEDVIASATVTVTPVEPEESGEFWDLADIEPLSKKQLIELAESEGIDIDPKALKKDIFKKVKKGLGL